MNPKHARGLWGSIAVATGIGVILSISLHIFLVGIVAVFPVEHWMEWVTSPALIGLGLQSLVFSLVNELTGAALLVTIAYAAVSFVLDKAIQNSLDADHA
ncbi:hypothetical protein ACEN2D_08640 [Corynebacterium auriscanis]|uniref:hypothetical protein n=1 Tax=Corynebacterium auriscanis TaxID=99807 RepID=UPI003CF403B5